MSLKQEIETWVEAMESYDKQNYSEALGVFTNIADTSKVLFNCGVIHATLGEHDRAVDCYQRAIQLDQYLAVAYFQQGVSNFLVGDFDEALANFNDTLLYLRGNTFIDYEQLGLKFKLYSCEVLFNRGLCYMYLQQNEPGMQDFEYAKKEKMTADHEVIDEAIKEQAEGYTVFSIPVGIIFRPNEAKVKNLKHKDYLGRARLVATANAGNLSTGFQGADQRLEEAKKNLAKDDRPAENISFAATNLVHKDLASRRTRDQSAPPTVGGRPQFPPTPPPETDPERPHLTARSLTMRNNPPKNLQLNGLSNGRTDSNLGAPSRSETEPTSRSETSSSRGYQRQGTLASFDMMNSSPKFNEKSPQMWNTSRANTNLGPSPRNPQGLWSAPGEKARPGTVRSSSESRGPPSSGLPSGSRKQFSPANSASAQKSFFAEQPGDEVYSMFTGKKQQSKEGYIEEEDEDVIIESDSDEILANQKSPQNSAQKLWRAPSSTSRRDVPVEMQKIRVKVHAHDDIRYIMINGTSIDYDDFESKVRAKFSLRGRLRMKSKDEDAGDFVTMGDQDDLDTLVTTTADIAKRERSEMGKMEVSAEEETDTEES